jgi:2-desacetyl-2-hydroxyethyl bacteriochlorophyllide A dehydrogenase
MGGHRASCGVYKNVRKLIWYGPEGLKLTHSSPEPKSPTEDEVAVKIRAVGICGTDIHILNGKLEGAAPPMILGHEMAGEVVSVGSKVQLVRPLDRVTIDSIFGCGQCDDCLQGRSQFCAGGSEYGINRDGGCQDYLVVPERNIHRIPDSISFEEAAVLDVEVWSAIRKCGIHKADRVLILGAGPIGLIACQFARILGAGHVTLTDILGSRLASARSLEVADEYREVSANGSPQKAAYDVVLECAGSSASTLHALSAARLGGRVLLFGVHEHPIRELDINQIVLRDLVVFGAMSDRTGWNEVIELVSSGALNLKDLITHRFALEEAALGYDAMRRREQGLIKAVLLL